MYACKIPLPTQWKYINSENTYKSLSLCSDLPTDITTSHGQANIFFKNKIFRFLLLFVCGFDERES